jgi:hypothetical protein
MVALVIVMIDEGFDLGFKITWQEVVFQQNSVLQRLMPSLPCPAVAACSDERGSYLGFEGHMAHHESVSCPCLAAIPPSRLRHSWTRCR